MDTQSSADFNLESTLEEIRHYLPSQAPLKDFIHHNPLHSFQDRPFFEALRQAQNVFGYKGTLSLEEYRSLYRKGRIKEKALVRALVEVKGSYDPKWHEELLTGHFEPPAPRLVGRLRLRWGDVYQIDLNSLVYPRLFRILNAYLDQGVAIWHFPVVHRAGFLENLRFLEKTSYASIFIKKRARKLLFDPKTTIETLLRIVVGKNPAYYRQYLFDQQFGHPGWSGMAATIENHPDSLLDQRNISLHDLVFFELLLEIDALDGELGQDWEPLTHLIDDAPCPMSFETSKQPWHEAVEIWQRAYEWSYFDEVLAGFQQHTEPPTPENLLFQALFCIDDRECSTRRSLEHIEPYCETFGTPGHFGIPAYYQPIHSKSLVKICPFPIKPKHVIKETHTKRKKRKKDVHFGHFTHTLWRGWLTTYLLGFSAMVQLIRNIFKPTITAATSTSLHHTHADAKLTVEYEGEFEQGMQVGFTIEEMADIVFRVLNSIGLTEKFAPLVYAVSHGSTTVNNPHYAAYDCGACSGRPGSVNARAFCYMANHKAVREILRTKGIFIPENTVFLAVLHDTTRDEFIFYDKENLGPEHKELHRQIEAKFELTSDLNAKERARRFDTINTHQNARKIHEQIIRRSVSIFEPRPELNHATDALCVIAPRSFSKGIFLDRRSFLNSYDYEKDITGEHLFNILSAAIPVCGGINLEYYFSRVDNHKLGVGTKLPLNVMGLIGVANGIDGDLKAGLPSQMVEIHEPVRLLFIVEQKSEIVLSALSRDPKLWEWVQNEWVLFACVHPKTKEIEVFKNGRFVPYTPMKDTVEHVSESDYDTLIEENHDFISPLIID